MTVAMALAACTPGEEASGGAATTMASLVADAIGTGIDTQDFHLVLDLAAVAEDGSATSFYDQVIARAHEGLGTSTSVSVDDVLTFTPTDSVRGGVVDEDGEPTLDVDGDCTAGNGDRLDWDLLRPDGNHHAGVDMSTCPQRSPIELNATGTWTLRVWGGANDTSTGTYRLRLLDRQP